MANRKSQGGVDELRRDNAVDVNARLAIIGGGSMFVPSIVNGIAQVMRQSPLPFGVALSLYDLLPDRAARMCAYAEVVRQAWGVPLQASVARSRAEALDGADVVLLSVWLQEEHERLDRFFGRLGFRLPEEGPEVAAWAVACAPWSLGVAAEMEAHCPKALLVTVMNPTDVIAGVVNAGSSIRGVGLCVEVDGLRGALAYYFHVPDACIELTHAGVNHDGWVLDLQVDGRNGYALWRDRWAEIEQDPDYHPGNRGMRPILDLTGHLRSSAYHHWPYQVAQTPEQQACWEARSLRSEQAWRGKREQYLEALDEALRTGNPIVDPPGIHPERSRLNYPYTGLTVGRWTQSVATGLANVLPLQVPNRRVAPPGARGEGVLSNFPAEAIVEVPVRVQGRAVQAMPVGELPEWLGGYTRLLAIQRQLIVAYVLDRRLETLKRALAVLPMFGTVQQLNRFAEALHCEFGAS